MTHLIDKDAIVAEINNWIKDAKRRYTLSKVQFSLSDRIESLENLLSFLNTLEVKDDMDTIHPIEDVISNDPIANSYKEKYEQALEVAKETYNTQPMYREWLDRCYT